MSFTHFNSEISSFNNLPFLYGTQFEMTLLQFDEKIENV